MLEIILENYTGRVAENPVVSAILNVNTDAFLASSIFPQICDLLQKWPLFDLVSKAILIFSIIRQTK